MIWEVVSASNWKSLMPAATIAALSKTTMLLESKRIKEMKQTIWTCAHTCGELLTKSPWQHDDVAAQSPTLDEELGKRHVANLKNAIILMFEHVVSPDWCPTIDFGKSSDERVLSGVMVRFWVLRNCMNKQDLVSHEQEIEPYISSPLDCSRYSFFFSQVTFTCWENYQILSIFDVASRGKSSIYTILIMHIPVSLCSHALFQTQGILHADFGRYRSIWRVRRL